MELLLFALVVLGVLPAERSIFGTEYRPYDSKVVTRVRFLSIGMYAGMQLSGYAFSHTDPVTILLALLLLPGAVKKRVPDRSARTEEDKLPAHGAATGVARRVELEHEVLKRE